MPGQTVLPRDLPSSATDKASFRAGAVAFAPVMVGVIPFGVITGVLMLSVGIAPADAWIMTVLIMSGAAHVAVVDLMAQSAPLAVIVFTGVVINLRFIMYSATLGPVMRGVQPWRKALYSYMLSDQAFALSMAEFHKPQSTVHKVSYYAGTAVSMYLTWIVSVTAGIMLGAAIPDSLQLDFAIPLTFMALLVPSLQDRTHTAAAVVAAITALLAHGLPWGLGLVLAAAAGIATGFTLAKRSRRKA